MGVCYNRTGRPSKGTVYHMGGILLTVGWFLLWVSLNAINALPSSTFSLYLPIYFSERLKLVIIGIVLIICVHWSSSYAYDDDRRYDVNSEKEDEVLDDRVTQGPGFGIGQYFLGHIYHVKFMIILSWIVLSLCSFTHLYMMSTIWQPITLCCSIVLSGTILAIQNEYGIVRRNESCFWKTFAFGAVVWIALPFVAQWNTGQTAFNFVNVGVYFIMAGTLSLSRDRKRDLYFLRPMSSTKIINPQYSVYSTGPVLYTIGMITLGWGLSIP